MSIKRALRKRVFMEKTDKMLLSIAITFWLKCEVICFFLKKTAFVQEIEPEKNSRIIRSAE